MNADSCLQAPAQPRSTSTAATEKEPTSLLTVCGPLMPTRVNESGITNSCIMTFGIAMHPLTLYWLHSGITTNSLTPLCRSQSQDTPLYSIAILANRYFPSKKKTIHPPTLMAKKRGLHNRCPSNLRHLHGRFLLKT